MKVFVTNKNGSLSMPCGPAKAGHLPDAGKAEVAGLFPFTVRLTWDYDENVRPVGIDKGTVFCSLQCGNRSEKSQSA